MSMVERVARATYPEIFRAEITAKRFVESAGMTWEGSWEQNVHKPKIEEAMSRSRIAIEAMRKLTPAMSRAMVPMNGAHYVVGDPPKVWRLAIDAALSEEEEG